MLAAAAMPAVAQRRAAPTAAIAPWLGCYRIVTGPWSTSVDSAYAPPPSLRLDSLPAAAPPARRGRWLAVEGAMPAFAARRPLLATIGWRPSSGDSATVVWGDGFVRVTATFRARGDSVAGTAVWRRVTPRLDAGGRAITDRAAHAALAGVRVPCPR